MTINVTARNTTVKDSFKDVLNSKLARFDKFFSTSARADVTVTDEGGRETVEITMNSDGMVFRSEVTTQDRYDSLDAVVDKLSRQIVKNKSKVQTKLRKQTFDFVAPSDMEEQPEEKSYRIVRSKEFALKPMDPDEAILQMNMLGHNFFMFMNSITNEVCVVYKRNDGHYGLIEPVAEK